MAELRPDRACVTAAWAAHEGELRGWLHKQLGDPALADDVLQTVFLRALDQGARFCALRQTRGWLFTVARNAIIDLHRLRKVQVPVPESLPVAGPAELPPVEALAVCLPAALATLDPPDADVIRRCDLEGQTQAAYAAQHGLSVPGAKSRLQRARRRLAAWLTEACQVQRDDTGQVCCFVPGEPEDRQGGC